MSPKRLAAYRRSDPYASPWGCGLLAVARRKGARWYLGAMNADNARDMSLPLNFLGSGRFTARLWQDGGAPDQLREDTRRVSASDQLTLHLAASGGAVAMIDLADKEKRR